MKTEELVETRTEEETMMTMEVEEAEVAHHLLATLQGTLTEEVPANHRWSLRKDLGKETPGQGGPPEPLHHPEHQNVQPPHPADIMDMTGGSLTQHVERRLCHTEEHPANQLD